MATTATKMELNSELIVREDLGLTEGADVVELSSVDNHKLFGDTTPDVELVYRGTVALSTGTATMDLTNLTNTKGETIATTDKKVRAIKLVPTSSNTGAITLAEGASNGYELFGASFSIALTAGQHLLAYMETDAPDVTASTCEIDLTGTGSESIDVMIVFG